jgi:hypothetical protein
MAAGLSLTEVEQLLATPQAVQQAKKLQQLQGAAGNHIKALKVLLSGKKSVFEAEFGGTAPKRMVGVVDPTARGLKAGRTCGEDYQDGGSCTDLSCGTHGCSQESEGSCNDVNVCDGQSCDNQGTCKDNYCVGQTCDSQNCGKNEQKPFSSDFIDRNKTDPFIQDLFKEYNVKTSSELSTELQTMVQQRRKEMSPIKK